MVAPYLLPVAVSLFADRAERFASLAINHSLGEWLVFLAGLSRAQHHAQQTLPEPPLPTAAALERARAHGMPPLDLSNRPTDWRDTLRAIVDDLLPDAPVATHRVLEALAAVDDARLEKLADVLLNGEIEPSDSAELPFVAAALQVVYTRLASRLDANSLQKPDASNVCPCCGSPAVASIVRLGLPIDNLRYLHCSLCNTEWNVPRATCTTCASDKNVALKEIDGQQGTVRAEICDNCKSYLKIVYQDKNPRVDPVADDLATLALDLLVDEAGYQRAGPNLLLIGAWGDSL
jgi:FdhE protein